MEHRILPFYMAYPFPMLYQDEDTATRDLTYISQMYPIKAKQCQKRVAQLLDRLDYEGSMIYDEYPDKIQLLRLADMAFDIMQKEEMDEDMGKCESIDTSDTNWIAAYQEQHESIEDLLCAFKELLDEHITTMINDMQCHIEIDKARLKRFQYLKSECEGWVTHDFEVVE